MTTRKSGDFSVIMVLGTPYIVWSWRDGIP